MVSREESSWNKATRPWQTRDTRSRSHEGTGKEGEQTVGFCALGESRALRVLSFLKNNKQTGIRDAARSQGEGQGRTVGYLTIPTPSLSTKAVEAGAQMGVCASKFTQADKEASQVR